MNTLKFCLRLIIALIFILPSIPIIWLAVTIFGIGLIIPVTGIFELIGGWLTNNSDMISDGKESFILFGYMMAFPFIFWYDFVVNAKLNLEF